MVTVYDVTCEYFKTPLGLDLETPRISWKLQSEEKNVLQRAYTVQVAEDPDFQQLVSDSGWIESEQSTFIELAGAWSSRSRYYYRVKVKDNQENTSGWSDTAWFEMGLHRQEDWQAQWIAPPENLNGEPCPVLSRTIEIKEKAVKARLYITALGLYEMNINGSRTGDMYFTPGWTSYQERVQYQVYDVTGQLHAGENELEVFLGNGWYKGFIGFENRNNFYGDRLALLAQLEVTYESGETEIFATDDQWQAEESSIQLSEIYHGETYDARIGNTQRVPVELYQGKVPNIVTQENEPVRKQETFTPIELIHTPKGDTVLDFGQNMVGWVQFTLEGSPGQEVKLYHAEVLDRDGNFYTENLRSAKQAVSYTFRGGEKETYEPKFSFQGFRYVKLEGFNEEQVQLEAFKGIVLYSDMKFTGDFSCSDELVNQLQHNIVWGLKGNFLDVPTDCPQRDERLGWTGDAQMFISTAAYLANAAPFFRKWLRDLTIEQREDGGVPFVIPDVIIGDQDPLMEDPHSSAAWGDAAVICPWTIYEAYGDKKIIEDQYPSMKAWIEYIRSQGENEFLWETGFHFGDWLALDSKPDSYIGATDKAFIATAFFAYSTSIVKKAARLLDLADEAAAYEELENNIVDAFTKEFITPAGRIAVPTQTAHITALMFGLLEGKAKDRAVEKLTSLLEEEKWHLTTGFVGTPYLNLVLSENGRHDIAETLLFQQDYPSWLYQITKGATTIWEHWDGIKEDGSFWSADMNSFNHYAYGAIGDWLYRKVAGIERIADIPGYKKFRIQPELGEKLAWAEGTLETMYGEVKSKAAKENGKIRMEVTVPPNTTAEIIFPADVQVEAESELHIVRENGEQKAVTGSGTYIFSYQPQEVKV
ncbi:alpha-L-rhamnosidase [Alkalicoccus daliensis]|uniref:alpha-L-rhamnosidase n=1 Tax=Alkalicoccus daliensis TaxID=745820 RepID=A0A1H0F2G2_9BACI|nr:alpha-L-rhamnosidase [Alkalicoccus daliensis]SDN88781.1 alpha-L-rhamnosidase [Alkalicoccus daliensis]